MNASYFKKLSLAVILMIVILGSASHCRTIPKVAFNSRSKSFYSPSKLPASIRSNTSLLHALSTKAPSYNISLNNHESYRHLPKNKAKILGFDQDLDGNYIVGGVNDPYDGNWATPLFSTGFISKINPQGRILWEKTYDNTSFNAVEDIQVDSQNNIVAVIEANTNAFQTINGTSHNYEYYPSIDIYVEKLTSNGHMIWGEYFGGIGYEGFNGIEIDEFDNIYVITESITSDIPTFPITFNITGSYPLFQSGGLFKILPNGTLDWSTLIGGTGYEQIINLKYMGDGKLMLAMWSTSTDFPRVNDTTTIQGESDVMVLEIDLEKKEIMWTRSFGGTGNESPWDFIQDTDGNLYVLSVTFSTDFNTTAPFVSQLNGIQDLVISKLNSDHNLMWSRYFGGNRIESPMDLIMVDNNVVILGTTDSPDFITTDGSTHINQTDPNSDPFVASFDKDTGDLVSSTIIASEGNVPDGHVRTIHNDLYIGFSIPPDIYIHGIKEANVYPYTFDTNTTAGFYKFNKQTLMPNLITNVAVVPDPNLDYDHDGLTNWQEYNLYFDGVHVDPTNPDSDGDGLPDGWEVMYGLSPDRPNDPSTLNDNDNDGLTNLQEYQFGTSPISNDTDSDGMLDKYEYYHGLNGTFNDSMADLDGDGMTNLYEAQNDLNASNFNDYNMDPDHDKLINLEEFSIGTKANNNDTDGDGIDDGTEVKFGLNPLKADANLDYDHDGLSNGYEVRHNLNPHNPIELYLPLTILFIAILSVLGWKYYTVKRNTKARSEGYLSYRHQTEINKVGYTNYDEYKHAIANGLYHKKSADVIQNLGFSSFKGLSSTIEQDVLESKSKFSIENLSPLFDKIKAVNTPLTLLNVKKEVQVLSTENRALRETLLSYDKAVTTIHQVNDKAMKSSKLLEHFDTDELLKLQASILEAIIALDNLEETLFVSVNSREEWLKPWPALLKLIKLTAEKAPVPIEDIIQVVNVPQDQAVELIELLLKEYPSIGEFDSEKLIYYKSSDLAVMNYMKLAKEFLSSIGG